MTTRTLRRLSTLDHPLFIGLAIFVVLAITSLVNQAPRLLAPAQPAPPIILIATPTAQPLTRSSLTRGMQLGVLHASKGVAPTLRAAPEPTTAPVVEAPPVLAVEVLPAPVVEQAPPASPSGPVNPHPPRPSAADLSPPVRPRMSNSSPGVPGQ